MLSVYVGTLKIHDAVNATDFWLQTPIEGLDAPEDRVNVYDKPGEDGAVVSSMFYSGRRISLQGMIKGANPAAYEANRLAFLNAVLQRKDDTGYPTPIRVTFTNLSGATYYVDAYIRKPIMDYDQINYCKFMLTMVCANPFIFGSASKNTTINPAVGGGAVLPFILPVILAPSSGGSGSLVNSGSGNAFPIIKLTGPLTNPYLANNTVGKFMQLNYTIPAGHYVTIDMAKKTILLDDSSSILSTKTSDSDWWAVIPGTNNLQLSTGNSADSGNALITINDAYLGI